LKPNMNKRERLSRNLRSTFSNHSQHSRRREPSKRKNTTISKKARESLSRLMKLRTKSSKRLTTSSI